MNRYNIIENKNKREIVLLKSYPCMWGRCKFCDYISDNCIDKKYMNELNIDTLSKVTGKYNKLEVINSASVFELPYETLEEIKRICIEKNINTLYFEAYYNYKNRLDEIKNFFSYVDVRFKCGVETFDERFRNKVLNKNLHYKSIEEISEKFDTICLLFGIKGQTKKMIDNDIKILLKYFNRGCINIFVENSTYFKTDFELVSWFRDKYSYLESYENIEILWNNLDFGVGN